MQARLIRSHNLYSTCILDSLFLHVFHLCICVQYMYYIVDILQLFFIMVFKRVWLFLFTFCLCFLVVDFLFPASYLQYLFSNIPIKVIMLNVKVLFHFTRSFQYYFVCLNFISIITYYGNIKSVVCRYSQLTSCLKYNLLNIFSINSFVCFCNCFYK